MPTNITFTEDQITGLFGELAAEDEEIVRFKSSFFKSSTYAKIHNERPLRIFEDNNYLSTENIEFGYDWEVHPAFRWALYPEARDIFSGIDLPNLV